MSTSSLPIDTTLSRLLEPDPCGIIETVGGRSSSVRIERDHDDLNIGVIFRQLEEISEIVDCDDGPCVLDGNCTLKRAFDKAKEAFISELDQLTLVNLEKRRGHLQKIAGISIRGEIGR